MLILFFYFFYLPSPPLNGSLRKNRSFSLHQNANKSRECVLQSIMVGWERAGSRGVLGGDATISTGEGCAPLCVRITEGPAWIVSIFQQTCEGRRVLVEVCMIEWREYFYVNTASVCVCVELQCRVWDLLRLSPRSGNSRSGLQWPSLWPALSPGLSLWGMRVHIHTHSLEALLCAK